MHHRLPLLAGLAALVALAGACAEASAPGDGTPAADGGARDDGGPDPSLDAGPDVARDAGARRDGGASPDAGPPGDAGPDAGSPGDGGADGGAACPEEGCDDVTVSGVLLPACCPLDGTGCGYDLRSAAPLLGLVAGEVSCVETDQPGGADADCPDRELLDGFLTLDGCCRPSGACGYLAEAASLGLPSLGCVAYDLFVGVGTPARCTP